MLVFCNCGPKMINPMWKINCWFCFLSYMPQSVMFWGVLRVVKHRVCSRLNVVSQPILYHYFVVNYFLLCSSCNAVSDAFD